MPQNGSAKWKQLAPFDITHAFLPFLTAFYTRAGVLGFTVAGLYRYVLAPYRFRWAIPLPLLVASVSLGAAKGSDTATLRLCLLTAIIDALCGLLPIGPHSLPLEGTQRAVLGLWHGEDGQKNTSGRELQNRTLVGAMEKHSTL
jgi:hypothetical protein